MGISGISNALSAIRAQSVAMDRAAERVSRAGLTESSATDASQTGEAAVLSNAAPENDLVDGMVGMLIARRMFTAAIRTAQSMNETMMETVNLSGYGVEA